MNERVNLNLRPVTELKAISMHQPWATLVILGIKKIETRSWAPTHRGPMAIHSARTWSQDQINFTKKLIKQFPKKIPRSLLNPILGAVLGVVTLQDTFEMDQNWLDKVSNLEDALGNHDEGQYGWVLENPIALSEPYPLRGHQGVFDLPKNAAQEILKMISMTKKAQVTPHDSDK